ncbi:hypothetical protein Bhyg_14332 [Pseudolycoriella hygida]|uniref:Uncharacterized protein n=1 Tax=Pseudolycoriella hygida TaxID=35572 RepID=A0A9Q0MPZ3_9DIPT|nr:hypothetical protein Bhyg_14332 [Pseudolycoriella hygida]
MARTKQGTVRNDNPSIMEPMESTTLTLEQQPITASLPSHVFFSERVYVL